jgi:putative transposase
MEGIFSRYVPSIVFPKMKSEENSRDRRYTRARTFWSMIWQALNPRSSGREVVRQLQALISLQGGASISSADGAYCRAKARLPLSKFIDAISRTATEADRQSPAAIKGFLQERPLKAIDGASVTLNDTPANRQDCPPIQCPGPSGFPMMRVVALYSLLSGAIRDIAVGSALKSELSMFASLLGRLAKNDILVGDRGFGCYPAIALLKAVSVDFLGTTRRKLDARKSLKKFGCNDWLGEWENGGAPSPWMTPEQKAALPATIIMRVIKAESSQKGWRTRRITIVTTLLDAKLYPAEEIVCAYARRWRLEMCFNDLKTTMNMEFMRARTPEMAKKEICARVIAHNLIRCTIAAAASEHDVKIERLSFRGSLDSVRHFALAIARGRSRKKRQQVWADLLRTIGEDLVRERPGRREPRAIKRKKNKYPRLNTARNQFKDHPKRHERRSKSRATKASA